MGTSHSQGQTIRIWFTMLPTLSSLTLTNTLQTNKCGNFLKYLRIKDARSCEHQKIWQLFSWSMKFLASLKPHIINYIYIYLPQDLILTHTDQAVFQIHLRLSFCLIQALLSGHCFQAMLWILSLPHLSCYLPLQFHPIWFACNNMWRVVLQITDEVYAFSHMRNEFPSFRKLSPSPL